MTNPDRNERLIDFDETERPRIEDVLKVVEDLFPREYFTAGDREERMNTLASKEVSHERDVLYRRGSGSDIIHVEFREGGGQAVAVFDDNGRPGSILFPSGSRKTPVLVFFEYGREKVPQNRTVEVSVNKGEHNTSKRCNVENIFDEEEYKEF